MRRFLPLLLLASPLGAVQCLYPDGDEDNSTYYWTSPGASTTHYTIIDDDTTCVGTSNADDISEDSGATYRMTLTNATDPTSSTNHTWYCYAYRSSNKANTLTINLYQGTTQINTTTTCSGTVTNGTPGAKFPAGGCTLSGTEADSITDYTDLRIRVTATATSPTDVFVDTCNLEVPDAAGGADEFMFIGAP